MRKLIVFVIALVIGLFFFHQWWNRFPPFDGHGEPVDVAFSELHNDYDEVRVSGLAHHVMKVSRVDPGGLLQPERTFWIWPLFAPNDTDGRIITVVVASLREPPWGVDFEDVVVEGLLRPLRSFVSVEIEERFIEVGYDVDPEAVVIELFAAED